MGLLNRLFGKGSGAGDSRSADGDSGQEQSRFRFEFHGLAGKPASGVLKPVAWDEIAPAIDRFCSDHADGSFAILALRSDELTYVQAAPAPEPGAFRLEYQAGDTDRHFELADEAPTADHVRAIFETFFADPASMNDDVIWRQLVLKSARGRRTR